MKKVKGGSDLVAKTKEAFGEVANSAAKDANLVTEIAAASNEQAQGVEHVNMAVVKMDKVVEQNAANAKESAASIDGIRAQSTVDTLIRLNPFGCTKSHSIGRAVMDQETISS